MHAHGAPLTLLYCCPRVIAELFRFEIGEPRRVFALRKFVFVRHDAHRTPLQCTYNGPFRVLERAAKYFTLDLRGKRDTVSVDRLKPAFVDADWGLHEESVSSPPTRTQPAAPPPPSTSKPLALGPPPSKSRKKTPAPPSEVNPPLRIVKRSRRGRAIRLPAKLQ